MRHQVQPRALGQRLRQRQRVGHRAEREGRVVQRIDAVGVMLEQRGHALRVLGPELAEGAGAVAESAVDEDQQGPVRGGQCRLRLDAAALQLRQRVSLQRIHTGVDLGIDAHGDLFGGQFGQAVAGHAADDLETAEQGVADQAAGGAARGRDAGAVQAGPGQLRRHHHVATVSGRAAVAHRAGLLRQHQVARALGMQHQRRPARDMQHDHVAPRHGLHARFAAAVGAAAQGAHAQRVSDLAAQQPGGQSRGGGAARGAACAGGHCVDRAAQDEGDRRAGPLRSRRGAWGVAWRLAGSAGHHRLRWIGVWCVNAAPQRRRSRRCAAAGRAGRSSRAAAWRAARPRCRPAAPARRSARRGRRQHRRWRWPGRCWHR